MDFDAGKRVLEEKLLVCPIEAKKIEDEECKLYIKLERIDIEHENEEQHQKFIKSEELIIKDDEDELDEQDDVYINDHDVGINELDFVDVCSGCSHIVAVNDNPVLMGIVDRAAQSVPKGTLSLRSSDVNGAGIYSNRHLKKGVRLGPYQGHTTKVQSTNSYAWKISEGKLVDASDETSSNYLSYVNYAKDISEQNLVAVQYKGELYYQTCRDIEKGEELLIYFDGNQNETYYHPIEENFDNKIFICQVCKLAMRYESHRNRHQMFCQIRTDEIDDVFLCKNFAVSSDPKHAGEGTQIESVESREKYETSEGTLSKYDGCCYKTTLSLNKEKHNQTNTFKCDYESVSKLELNRHQHRVKQDQKKVLKCTDCDYETYYKSNLKIHQLKHNSTDVFKCANCKFETYYKEYLIMHMQIHSLRNMFKCAHCSYETNTIQKLYKHKVKHNQKKLLKCTDCDYETYYKSRIKRHQFKHNSTDVFRCAHCNFETYCKEYLILHMQKHSLINMFKCTHCSYETNTVGKLYLHKLKHDQKRLLKCTDCDYETYYKYMLKTHQLKHNSTDVFKCANCKFETYNKRYIILHVKKHSLINMFKCTQCSYKTNTNSKLYLHKLKHDPKRLLKCTDCDYKTYYKYQLKRHQLTHNRCVN